MPIVDIPYFININGTFYVVLVLSHENTDSHDSHHIFYFYEEDLPNKIFQINQYLLVDNVEFIITNSYESERTINDAPVAMINYTLKPLVNGSRPLVFCFKKDLPYNSTISEEWLVLLEE